MITEEEALLRKIFDEPPEAETVAKIAKIRHDCLNSQWHYLTAGRLRQLLDGLPDNAPVYYHRIEDVYFEKYNWTPDVKMDQSNQLDDSCHGDYILGFDAFRRRDDDALYITAHY